MDTNDIIPIAGSNIPVTGSNTNVTGAGASIRRSNAAARVLSGITQIVNRDTKIYIDFLKTQYPIVYEEYTQMLRVHPKLYGSLLFISNVVGKSYNKVSILPELKSRPDIDKLNEFRDRFAKICSEIKLNSILEAIIFNGLKNGDVVFYKKRGVDGRIKGLQMLPPEILTAVNKERVIKQVIDGQVTYTVNNSYTDITQDYIDEPDYYVLNEGSPKFRKVFPKQDIWHISFNSIGNRVKDNQYRETWGIWGMSVLEPLRFDIRKACIIEYLDIKQWYLGIPRWIFNLAVGEKRDDETPTEYDTRVEQAIKDFKTSMLSSNASTGEKSLMSPEEMIILTEFDKAELIDGKTATNDILKRHEEIDRRISSITGIPTLFLGQNTTTFAAGYIAKTYMTTRGAGLLKAVEIALKPLVQEQFDLRSWYYEEEWFDFIFLDYTTDDADAELIKAQITKILGDGGYITINEGREINGLNPIADGDNKPTPTTKTTPGGTTPGGTTPGTPILPTEEQGMPGMTKNQITKMIQEMMQQNMMQQNNPNQ